MNPVVLIATNNRREITTANISTLLQQTYRPEIGIIISNGEEAKYYSTLPVKVIAAPNFPVGAKWQTGVNYVRNNMHASHLIITGSDDILSKDFVRRFCTGIPFVGLQRWYIWDARKSVLYLMDYLAAQCLGGGRVYTKALLESVNWQIFDHRANRLLDNRGWRLTGPLTRQIIKDEGYILAVKGDWPVMNPLDVNHKNVKIVARYQVEEAKKIMQEKFNYVP